VVRKPSKPFGFGVFLCLKPITWHCAADQFFEHLFVSEATLPVLPDIMEAGIGDL